LNFYHGPVVYFKSELAELLEYLQGKIGLSEDGTKWLRF
jgi:hypothetical protein